MKNDYERLRDKEEALARHDAPMATMIEGLAEDPKHFNEFIATVAFSGHCPHKIGNLPEVDRAMLGRLINWASLQIAAAVLKRRIQLASVVDDPGVEIVGRCHECGKQVTTDGSFAFTGPGELLHVACADDGPLYTTKPESVA